MSTDTEDTNFDETLKNLHLLNAATSDRTSASSGAVVNPFQIAPSAEHHHHRNEAIVKQIFGARCECGAERTPLGHKGSAAAAVAPSGGHKHSHGSLEHGIINPTPFKHKVKGEKKTIVREAILKNIGKCVHQNLVKQNNLSKELAKQQQRLSANTFLPAPSPLKPSRSENNLTKGFNQDTGDDILDFRLLVAQCSELTLSNGSGSKPSDGPNFSRNSFKTLRQPDIFAAGSSNPMSFVGPSRRNRRARQLKRYNSTSSLESDSSSSNGSVPAGASSSSRTPLHNPGSSQQQQQQQQLSPSASSSPTSSSSASCSTQARLNSAAMPCDITIDEMASYFETLVHIPKKMSSMAEMMYI